MRINLDYERQLTIPFIDSLETRLLFHLQSIANNQANPPEWGAREPSRIHKNALKFITDLRHYHDVTAYPGFNQAYSAEHQLPIVCHGGCLALARPEIAPKRQAAESTERPKKTSGARHPAKHGAQVCLRLTGMLAVIGSHRLLACSAPR
jgi:hypothetical protein